MTDRALTCLRRFRTIERNRLKLYAERALQIRDIAADQRDKAELVGLQRNVEKRYQTMSDYDAQIVAYSSLPEEDLDREFEESDEHSNAALECSTLLKRLIDEVNSVTAPVMCNGTTDSPSTSTAAATTTSSSSSMPSQFIISSAPPVFDTSPEVFDGDILGYRAFIAQFDNWVSRSIAASATDRLVALRKLLRGPPKQLVDSLPVNDVSYKVALKLLEDNYGRLDSVITHCCVAALSQPARDIERLRDSHYEPPGLSSDDAVAVRQFEESVSYDGKEYTVSLPRKDSISQLWNNKSTALVRLESKLRSLRRDPETYKRYDDEVMAFVHEGHAEELFDVDLEAADNCDDSFFMPHHQVITTSGTTSKVWTVFDRLSSAQGKTSRNHHLFVEPNLNPEIVKLLINLRLHRVAISADITKAYMRINLTNNDRRLFRYLWRVLHDEKVRCFQMKRVTWGAAPSDFLLAGTIRRHLKHVDPDSTLRLPDSLNYDDILCSSATDSEAWDQPVDSDIATQFTRWTNEIAALLKFKYLAGPVKSTLAKTLGRSLITFEEFRTIICKLTSVIFYAVTRNPVTMETGLSTCLRWTVRKPLNSTNILSLLDLHCGSGARTLSEASLTDVMLCEEREAEIQTRCFR